MASTPNNARANAQPSPAHANRPATTTMPSASASGHNNGLRPPSAGVPSRTPSQNTNSSHRSRASAPGSKPPLAAAEPPYVIDGPGGRIACVADVRGNLSLFNQIAADTNAQAIIHTGDFGFYDHASLERISDRTLRHLVQYSTLIEPALRTKLLAADAPRAPAAIAAGPAADKGSASAVMRQHMLQQPGLPLSQFSDLLVGKIKLNVPVFTVWGACEDVAILERFRTGEYQVNNLHVLDEASTKAIEVGGVRLRLFGLGGAVVLHKLFDNGEGAATIAGGQGTMWTTALQIGELVDTAQKTFDPTETRVLITHASPGREGLLAQLALALKADLTISAGLHFRYGVSYNEFSVQHDAENYRNKLQHAKHAFGEIWDTVKTQVDAVIDENQRMLLNNALAVANRVAPTATATGAASEEPAWKNTWNWNLPDAAYGHLVLGIKDGRVSAETKSQGFNFAYRRSGQPMAPVAPTGQATAAAAAPAPAPAAPRATPAAAAIPAAAAAPAAAQRANAAANAASNAGTAAVPTKVNASKPAEASVAAAGASGAATPASKTAAASPASAKPVKEKKERTRERGHESAASRSDFDGGFTSGTDGRKSPSGPRKVRNPFTLYVSQLKEALPVTEDELRTYFGPAAAGITGIKLVFDKPHRRGASSGKEDAEQQRRQRPFAYVEFRDEAAMAAGFKRQGEAIKGDVKPVLEQADSNKASQSQPQQAEAGASGTDKESKRERQASGRKGGETDKEDEAGKSADDKPAGRNSRQRKDKAKAEGGAKAAAAAQAADSAATASADGAAANEPKEPKEPKEVKEAKETKDVAPAAASGAGDKEKKDKKETAPAPAPAPAAAPAPAPAAAAAGGEKKDAPTAPAAASTDAA
ncbi:ser thr protein phosphatase [Moesziomyces aphidis]|uniref:Ser thr protein phosphatase n=1 Tax=Moesziomyces aphidis TaxID=84754 RepID=W3VDT7_MOEAP|nr:ser thr protein phosphatase [Moesziomyces aphidis]